MRARPVQSSEWVRSSLPRRAIGPAFQAGLAYEKRVTCWLLSLGGFYPQIEFVIDNGVKLRPDGLLLRDECLYVIEVKNQLDEHARIQLERYLYAVGSWYHGKVRGLLICNNYRRDLKLHHMRLVRSIEEALDGSGASLAVLPMGAKHLPKVRRNAPGGCGGDERAQVRQDY